MNCSLSRDDMIAQVLAQFEQMSKVQAAYEALKMKLGKGKQPPTNSSNSSQPPSWDQRPNQPKNRQTHKHGPPYGHAKHERQFVADPDRVVEVRPQVCKDCQVDLSQESSALMDVQQITELPEARVEVKVASWCKAPLATLAGR